MMGGGGLIVPPTLGRLWRGTRIIGLGGTHPKGSSGHSVWVHTENFKKKYQGAPQQQIKSDQYIRSPKVEKTAKISFLAIAAIDLI